MGLGLCSEIKLQEAGCRSPSRGAGSRGSGGGVGLRRPQKPVIQNIPRVFQGMGARDDVQVWAGGAVVARGQRWAFGRAV